MKQRGRRAPRPVAPDSVPSTQPTEAERARRVNEVLEGRGLERPQIDAWWGTRREENEFRSRTEMWRDGEFDAVERQAEPHAG